MADAIIVQGEQYISSKRASETTGYAQDYIGQLARKGLVDAKRIGGLWYISQKSLLEYKEKAEAYKPEPPQRSDRLSGHDLDSAISLDGKDYISAPRAAEITGYHQDYVGQLARSGKILSRRIGNRWYVERAGIGAHKKEKDALLAAVQAQAVGIPRDSSTDPSENSADRGEKAFFTYVNERNDLFPPTSPESEEEAGNRTPELGRGLEHRIPIRVVAGAQRDARVSTKHPVPPAVVVASDTRLTSSWRGIVVPVGAVFASFVLVLGIGYASYYKNSDVSYSSVNAESAPALAGGATKVFSNLADALERVLSPEFVYRRK